MKIDYPYMRAFGQMFFPDDLDNELKLARENHQSDNVICRQGDIWRTIDEIPTKDLREYVTRQAIMLVMEGAMKEDV